MHLLTHFFIFFFFFLESIFMYPHYFENQSIIMLIWHYSFLRVKHSYSNYFFHITHSFLWDSTTFFFLFFFCPCFTHWVDRRGRWSGKSLLVWYNKRNLNTKILFIRLLNIILKKNILWESIIISLLQELQNQII